MAANVRRPLSGSAKGCLYMIVLKADTKDNEAYNRTRRHDSSEGHRTTGDRSASQRSPEYEAEMGS